MPPSSTPTSAGRQTTLLGFFNKPTPGSSNTRPAPKTPNTSSKPGLAASSSKQSISRTGSKSEIDAPVQESPLTNKGKGKNLVGRKNSDEKVSQLPIRVEGESIDVDMEADEDVFTASVPTSTIAKSDTAATTPVVEPKESLPPVPKFISPIKKAADLQSSSPLSELGDLPDTSQVGPDAGDVSMLLDEPAVAEGSSRRGSGMVVEEDESPIKPSVSPTFYDFVIKSQCPDSQGSCSKSY